MKRYVVMHDYGGEGWKITAECDSLLDAVRAREADLSNGGGTVQIFEAMDTFTIYGRAAYERDRAEAAAATTKGA
jgi:hypothetical protein